MAPPKQASTDTSLENPLEGTIQPRTRVDRFAEYMRQRAIVDRSNRTGVPIESISERILATENAASDEEVWDSDEGGIPDGRAMVDIEQEILGYEVVASTNEDIKKASLGDTFLLIRCRRLEDGEEVIWNTSADLIVTKIMVFDRRGQIPGLKCVIRATDLGAGKAVLKLRPIPRRAI